MKLFVPKHIEEFIDRTIITKRGLPRIRTQLKYYYIVHKLIHESIFVRDRYREGVGLDAKTLGELFGKWQDVRMVIDDLIEWDFIIMVKAAQQGVNCNSYKLHPCIEGMKVKELDFDGNDAPTIRKLEIKNAELRKSFKGQLEILENYVTLNEAGVAYLVARYGENFYEDDVEMSRRDIALKKIYNKDFFAVRPDEKSRVHTNLTSLFREFRKFLHFDGRHIISTDLKNSQILLIVPLIQNYWKSHFSNNIADMPKDCMQFKIDTQEGKFYEILAKEAGIVISKDVWRTQFKKDFFKEKLFSKEYPTMTLIKTAFTDLYPTVDEFICKLKRPDHRQFSIDLQRLEASIIIDQVWKQMYEDGRLVLSIHDSILVNNEEDFHYANHLIRKAFFKYGITPSLKGEIFDEIGTILEAVA